MIRKITADTKKIVLSSIRTVYKTEGMIAPTRRIISVDAFVSRVAEGIFASRVELPDGCYSAETEDGRYGLYFRAAGDDLVFYKFSSADAHEGGTDRQLSEYLSGKSKITFILKETDDEVSE